MIRFDYKGMAVTADCSRYNTQIFDSWRFKSRKDMEAIIDEIRSMALSDLLICRLSKRRMIREWRAHNLLYALGYKREQTGSVDLDDEPWHRRAGYFVLSFLYWGGLFG